MEDFPKSTPLAFVEMPSSVKEKIFIIVGIALFFSVGFIFFSPNLNTFIVVAVIVLVAIAFIFSIISPFKKGEYFIAIGKVNSVSYNKILDFVKPIQNYIYNISLINQETGAEVPFSYAVNNANMFTVDGEYNFYFDKNYKLIGFEPINISSS